MPYLRPDGKTQVTIEYDDDDRPVRLDTVVVSSQHAEDIDLDALLTPDIAEARRRRRCSASFDIDLRRLPAAGQPDRPVRDRRPDGRRRPDRPQDHRRHLRRHGPPRRRRVLRQGPVQGRPLRPPTRCAGWPRTSSPPGWPAAARCRSPTRSARRTRSASSSRPSAPRRSRSTRSRRPCCEVFDLRPAAIIRDLDLLRPIYAADRRLRPLRPRAARLHLGAHRPGRRPQGRRRRLTAHDRSAAVRAPHVPPVQAAAYGRPARSPQPAGVAQVGRHAAVRRVQVLERGGQRLRVRPGVGSRPAARCSSSSVPQDLRDAEVRRR